MVSSNPRRSAVKAQLSAKFVQSLSRRWNLTVARSAADSASSLLRRGADVCAADSEGRTALHWCALQTCAEAPGVVQACIVHATLPAINAVQKLLDAQDKDGRTALAYAAATNNHAVARILLKSGANATIPDASGHTPLMIAVLNGVEKSTLSILASNSNVNEKSADGSTALMLACAEGRVAACRVLLSYGADTNMSDSTGKTALMRATEFGSFSTIKALLECGSIDAGARCKDGTALQIARKLGLSDRIIDILQSAKTSKISSGAQSHLDAMKRSRRSKR